MNPAVRRRIRLAFWASVAALVLLGTWLTRFGTRWPSIYYMTGPSMEPTIGAREYFLAWSPVRTVRRGELVIFRFEDEDGAFDVLRRVAGQPGDTVRMDRGALYVNGTRTPWAHQVIRPNVTRSPYATGGDILTWGPWVVPPDSFLLLADTRDMIGWPDSRFIGFVSRDGILARASRTLRGRKLN